jgi:hypothetical protein
MTIVCPACGRTIDVPDYWAAKPKLKVKCRCGSAVTLAAAHRLPTTASPQPTPASAAAVVPAATASAPAAPPAAEATATPSRPRWAAPAPATQTAGAPAVHAAPASPRSAYRVHWRRCVNHSSTPSTTVCPTCTLGYCQSCEKRVQNAMICPTCSNLCITVDDYANLEDLERLRARSLVEEIGTIVGYPLRDRLGFIVLAVFIGFFAFAAKVAVFGRGFAILLSEGVLYSYAFYVVSRVSDGDLRPVTPDFTELSDLARPLSLAFVAFVISWAPCFAVMFGLGLTTADGGPKPLALLLVGLAALWGVIYTPAAVTVAALTERMSSTLNPVLGVFVIRRMGTVYWQALIIFVAIGGAELLVRYVLGLMAPLRWILGPLVKTYAALAIGCTLGLAVFKRAPQLELG